MRPGKHLRKGAKMQFGNGELKAEVVDVLPDGNRMVKFDFEGIFLEVLEHLGKMPLPPYIKEELQDQERYQTVYSKFEGSVAAPTAGLHFTPELMDTIRAMGVGIAEVTLHVGLGTFRPVQEDEISDHKMHSEWYSISEETARRIRETKAAGHRGHRCGHYQLPHTGGCRCQVRRDQGLQRQHLHLPVPGGEVQLHRRSDHQLPSAGEHPDHVGVRPVRLRKDHARL